MYTVHVYSVYISVPASGRTGIEEVLLFFNGLPYENALFIFDASPPLTFYCAKYRALFCTYT